MMFVASAGAVSLRQEFPALKRKSIAGEKLLLDRGVYINPGLSAVR